jgi:hypothetical protein
MAMYRWVAPMLCAAAMAAGCASFDGRSLRPGAAAQEVRQLMGAPAAVYADGKGGESWAYPRGPAGLYTYMARIDAGGRLSGIDQVLDQGFFAQLRIGQDREQDVLRLFGPNWRSEPFPRQKEVVWTWRFRNPWGKPAQFQVTFDEAGLVKLWAQIEEDRSRTRWDVD